MHLHKNDLSTICSKENKFKWAPQTSLPREKQELKACRWECNNNMFGQPMGQVGPVSRGRAKRFPHLGDTEMVRNGWNPLAKNSFGSRNSACLHICKQKIRQSGPMAKIQVQPSQIIRGMKSRKKYSSRSFSRLAWCPWTSNGLSP